jgi:hypothetical protein
MRAPVAMSAAAQFKIPFMIGIVGHRDLVPGEVPQIRVELSVLLKGLRDSNPLVPLRAVCAGRTSTPKRRGQNSTASAT